MIDKPDIVLGRPRSHFDVTESTNAVAKKLAAEGAPEGSVVTAAFQTAGRGRYERVWESAPGSSALVSYILRPRRDPEEWSGLSLLAGVAVADAIRACADLQAQLKWPNDVLLGGRKVAGILLESGGHGTDPFVIVGIGVNLTQHAFHGEYAVPPVSLRGAGARSDDVEIFLSYLSEKMTDWYRVWDEKGAEPVLEAWRARSDMIGSVVTVRERADLGAVRAVDLAADGALLVECSNGSVLAIHAGDVLAHPADGEGARG